MTQEDQDEIGYCIRCHMPKGRKEDPDMCANCHKEIDEMFKILEEILPE